MIDLLVGFLTAILSGLGIGGGGLLVIWQVLVCGVEQLQAQGVNLLYFIFSSGAAMLVHLQRRRLPWRLIGALIITGALGVLVGCMLARTVEPTLIRRSFGLLLIVSGAAALFSK